MKTSTGLLLKLGITRSTARHLKIVDDFLESGETDAKKLLDKLGSWDESDLLKTENFLKTHNHGKR